MKNSKNVFLFTLSLLGGLETVSAEIQDPTTDTKTNLGVWKGTNDMTQYLRCDEGEVMVNMCVKGYDWRPCKMHNKKYDFMIQCAKVQRSPDTGSNIHWTRLGSDSEKIQEAEFGHYASCTADESGRPMVATGLRVEKQKDKRHHQLICKPISDYEGLVLDPADTHTICTSDDHRWALCPAGYAVTKTCAFGRKTGCETDICTGRKPKGAKKVLAGVQCTAIAGFTYKETVESEGDEEESFFEVENCKDELQFSETDIAYSVENSVSLTASVRAEVVNTSEQGRTVTDTLSNSFSISAERGLYGAEVTVSNEFEFGKAVETYRVNSVSYVKEQYNEETREHNISRELSLQGGLTWKILSWGAAVTAVGSYKPIYTKIIPGADTETVEEDVLISNLDLNESNFVLALSSADFDANYLRNSCRAIAEDFMTLSGPFANNLAGKQSSSMWNGVEGSTIMAGSKTAFNGKNRGLRGMVV